MTLVDNARTRITNALNHTTKHTMITADNDSINFYQEAILWLRARGRWTGPILSAATVSTERFPDILEAQTELAIEWAKQQSTESLRITASYPGGPRFDAAVVELANRGEM